MRWLSGAVIALASLATPVAAHSPHDVVESLAASPAFIHDGTAIAVMVQSEHRVLARTTDFGRSWQVFGEQVAIYQVPAIRFSPDFTQDGTIFMGTRVDGVWRSTDRGVSWARIDTNLPQTSILDLAVSPTYATTKRLALATTSGVHLTLDGGVTWWPVPGTPPAETVLNTVTYAPRMGGLVVFAGRDALYRSDDGGQNWTELATLPDQITTIACSPSFDVDSTLQVGMRDDGCAVSTEGGLNLVPHMEGLPENDTKVNAIAIAEGGTTFLITHEGVYRAAAPGQPWAPITTNLEHLSELTTDHYRSIVPVKRFNQEPTVFVAGFEGVFKSTDGGDFWRQCETYTQRINRSVVFSPTYADDRTMLFTNYGAGPIFRLPDPLLAAGALLEPVDDDRSADGGAGSGGGPMLTPGALSGGASSNSGGPVAPGEEPLTPDVLRPLVLDTRADGMSSLHVRPSALSPEFRTDGTLFVGHEGLWRSRDKGVHWDRLELPPDVSIVRGLAVSPGFPDDQLLFLGTAAEGLYRSDDAGDSWTPSDAGLPADFRCRELAVSPAFLQDGRIYAASNTHGLWGSSDWGASWQDLNDGLTATTLRTVRLSPDFPTDGLLVVASKRQGLFRSDDFGQTWAPLNNGLPDLDGLDTEGVAISPDYAFDQTMFCTLARGGNVFKSVDGGANWFPSGAGLPLAVFRDIQVSPEYATDRTVVVNSTEWSWTSTDAGQSWQRLPAVIRVDDESHQIVYDHDWDDLELTASHGEGVLVADQPGDWFEYEFYGDSVAWFAARSSDAGRADVFLDGQVVTQVDLYHPTIQQNRKAWSQTFPTHDWHTLRIRVTGLANPSSSGTWIRTDGVQFTFTEWPND